MDLQKGLCLQTAPSFKLSQVKISFGPFISLIEAIEKGQFETVISRSHKGWGDVLSPVEIKNQPLWLQVIHKNNLSNTLIGALIAVNNNLKGFHIKNSAIITLSLRLVYFKATLKARLKKLIGR